MAGLGLTQALQGYQRGVEWRQQQDEREREVQRRARIDEANKAASGVVESAFKSHVDSGGDPNSWRPDDSLMLKGLDARTNFMAKHGMWDDVVQNEAKATGLRTNIRNNAIDKAMLDYQQTQDPISMAQAVYPHVYDGKEIKFAKKLEDGTIEFSLSDGKKQVVKADAIPQMVERIRLNPAEVAKYEFMTRMKNNEALFKAEQDRATVKERGKEARDTEGVKHQNAMSLAEFNRASQEKIAAGNNATSIRVANIHKSPGLGDVPDTQKLRQVLTTDGGDYVGVYGDGTSKPLSLGGASLRAPSSEAQVMSMAKMLVENGEAKNVNEAIDKARGLLKPAQKAAQQPAGKPKFLGFE